MVEKALSPAISLLTIAICVLFSACGGTNNSQPPIPPPAVSVSVTGNATILQAGSIANFTAAVSNTANHSVTWSVNNVPGGNSSVGTISAEGVYTAPAEISDTIDVTIRANSQADASKSATANLRVFSSPRILTRIVDGKGEFYDRITGTRFIPRGMNYIRLQAELIAPWDVVTESHTTLSVGLYDSAAVEAAFAAMESLGYNTVRVFLDSHGATGGLGKASGAGLNADYLLNFADFLSRARKHHIYVLPTTDDLPKPGGYQEMVGPDCYASWPGCQILEYTTTAGVAAERKFWQDLVTGLVQMGAPMDALLGYELRNEYYYHFAEERETSAPLPLLPDSGNYTAANGKTYDMSSATERRQLMDDCLIYWTDETRDAIQQIAPGALVGVSFVTGGNPYVPTFGAAEASTMDFIDGHTGPGSGTTVAEDLTGWGKISATTAKPVFFGESAAPLAAFPVEADAAAALKQWQIDSCPFGITGWLLWSWDSYEHDNLGFPHWYATRDSGLVGQALAPINRPDPCAQ